jgi:adenylate kinase family enzyme
LLFFVIISKKVDKGDFLREVLEDFIKALEEERFSDAHEIMEKKWKEYKKLSHPLTKLLKGLINGATAFELVNRGNIDGANRLWEVYKKYKYLLKEGIEEYELFLKADKLLQTLKDTKL